MILGAASSIAADGDAHATLSESGADTCLGCHNSDRMLVIFRTAHGQRADPESPMASLQCEACHGPSGEHTDRRRTTSHPPVTTFGRTSPVSPSDQNTACTGCHEKDISLAWHGSVHERNDTTCVSCHQVHTERDPVGSQVAQADVCFDCHRAQRSDSMKPYAHPIRFNAMVCTDCHSPHASVADNLLVKNTTNELCVSCHTEFRGPVLFDHAPVSEDCTLCHEAHGSIHPALLNRHAPLLCQSCHSQRGHPSISYTDQSLAGGNPSAMVLGGSCLNCHTQVHGSNHPSGFNLMR